MMKERARTVSIVTLSLLAVAVFCLVPAGTVQAGMLTISEDFQDSASWEAAKAAGDWSYFWYGTEYVSPVVDWPATDPGVPAKGLELKRFNPNGAAAHVMYTKEGYTSEGGYNETGYCDDVQGSVILSPVMTTGTVEAMVLVRNTKFTMSTSRTAEGYAIGGEFNASGSTLVISRDPVNHTDEGTRLASLALTGNLSYTTLKLDFSAIGSTLTGSLYAWDDEDEDFTDLLGTVNAEDDTYTEGRVGLRMGTGSNYHRAYFANFNAEVIPEPATMLLLAGGLGIALRRRSR